MPLPSQDSRRSLALGFAVLLSACASAPVPDVEPGAALPDWLSARIAGYERQPPHEAPAEIWRIRHRGAPAYFVVSPCCDQFNPLLDARGALLCHPSGGFTGAGDGRCPAPQDPGSEAVLLWSHPQGPGGQHVPPRLDER